MCFFLLYYIISNNMYITQNYFLSSQELIIKITSFFITRWISWNPENDDFLGHPLALSLRWIFRWKTSKILKILDYFSPENFRKKDPRIFWKTAIPDKIFIFWKKWRLTMVDFTKSPIFKKWRVSRNRRCFAKHGSSVFGKCHVSLKIS